MNTFILTLENPDFLDQEGEIITPKGIVRIFRIENYWQERLFKNGIICFDLNEVLKVAQELQERAINLKKINFKKVVDIKNKCIYY